MDTSPIIIVKEKQTCCVFNIPDSLTMVLTKQGPWLRKQQKMKRPKQPSCLQQTCCVVFICRINQLRFWLNTDHGWGKLQRRKRPKRPSNNQAATAASHLINSVEAQRLFHSVGPIPVRLTTFHRRLSHHKRVLHRLWSTAATVYHTTRLLTYTELLQKLPTKPTKHHVTAHFSPYPLSRCHVFFLQRLVFSLPLLVF